MNPMKTEFNFFVVPTNLLEPHPDPTGQHWMDQVVSCQFYKAVKVIAEKYNVDYLTARSNLIKIQQNQSTFSLYGICCHVFEGKGWAASQFTFNCGRN